MTHASTRPSSPRTRFAVLAGCVIALAAAAQASAAKLKIWHTQTPANYADAHFENAVLSNQGTVRLGRELKPLTTAAAFDAAYVWDVVEDKDHNLYAATGNEGKLYKITPAGQVSVAWSGKEGQVLSLAAGPDGSVYAGTGPNGLVVQVPPAGEAKVLCETGESYVWALALDAKSGTLYAGTGPKGKVLKVTPDGKASVFYQSKQEHVLSVALGEGGNVYAGTDKNGLIYRIDPKGKGFVLFQAPQSEVRSLLVTPEAVYAGTSAPTKRRNPSGSASSGGAERTSSLPASGKPTGSSATKLSAEPVAAADSPASKDKKESDKPSAAPAPSSPSGGENSVFRIAPDGSVREVFREKALMLCLAKQDGRLLVGTGMDGKLFEVNEATREHSEIVRLDNGQIHRILRRADGGLVLAAGDPGKLYVLKDSYAAKGTVVSDAFDAKLVSKWGSLTWRADLPKGTKVTVAVRGGNVAEPDDTWSDWSAEQADPKAAAARVPACRFAQYRVTLTTDDPKVTPALHSVTLRYATGNQAPEVTSVDVPDLDAAPLKEPKKLKLKWSATDPNEDELTYNLYVRKDGWKEWALLEEGLTKAEFEWDTTTVPSGVYRVKVVASDRTDNPDESALTGERVSSPVAVANDPPAVSVRVVGVDGDRVTLEATASSQWVRLASASYALNGRKWVNVFPEDGLFDGKAKTFRFQSESLTPGTYVLVLRVKDAAGNVGSGDVVFTVQRK